MLNRNSWTVFTVLIAFPIGPVSGSAMLNVDMALVLHDAVQWLSEDRVRDFNAIVETLRNDFASVFDFEATRVSLVANVNGSIDDSDESSSRYGVWHDFTKLTKDRKVFDEAVRKLRASWGNVYLGQALKLVRERVFAGMTGPRVVLVLTIPEAERGVGQHTATEAELLLQSGVVILVVYEAPDSASADSRFKELLSIVNNTESIVNLTGGFENDFNYNILIKVKNEMIKQVCRVEKRCFYLDAGRNTCRKLAFRPSIQDNANASIAFCNHQSYTTPAPTSESCPLAECERTCDNVWKWSGPRDCSLTCGQVHKVPLDPPWKIVEFCNRTYDCPMCTGPTTEGTTPSRSGEQKSTMERASTSTTSQPWFIGFMLLAVAVVVAIVATIVIMVKVKVKA